MSGRDGGGGVGECPFITEKSFNFTAILLLRAEQNEKCIRSVLIEVWPPKLQTAVRELHQDKSYWRQLYCLMRIYFNSEEKRLRLEDSQCDVQAQLCEPKLLWREFF